MMCIKLPNALTVLNMRFAIYSLYRKIAIFLKTIGNEMLPFFFFFELGQQEKRRTNKTKNFAAMQVQCASVNQR